MKKERPSDEHPLPPLPEAPPPKPRKFKSECYMVAVDAFFLSMGRWTEHPTFAKKYTDPGKAAQDAEDLRTNYPNSKIRVVSVAAAWTVKEPA